MLSDIARTRHAAHRQACATQRLPQALHNPNQASEYASMEQAYY
jgi:hypothetical protein